MLARFKQQGVTLLELLVALTISTVVIAALVGLFFTSTRHNRITVEVSKLDTELNLVLNSMARDIQRAGYWANADTSSNNPFMQTGTTDITINPANDCILLTYDHDGDGNLPTLGSGSDDERYGYRLVGNVVQYRQNGAPFDCNTATANWENLTDSRLVNITNMQITLNTQESDIDGTPGGAVMQIRNVSISVTGELADDSTVTRTLSRTVRIYNDKYVP